MMNSLTITVPGVPPGLNHYVRHPLKGGHYLTPETKRFKRDVTIMVGNRTLDGKTFEVELVIYFGKGGRGDTDGLGKVVIDALAEAGVFRGIKPAIVKGVRYERPPLTDNCISDVIIRKRRDRHQPRTEITIRRTEIP